MDEVGSKIFRIEYVLQKLEKSRANIITIFGAIFMLGYLRVLLEKKLFPMPPPPHFPWGLSDIFFQMYYYRNTLLIISFYFCVFIVGITILAVLSREHIRKVANMAILGYSIILLPPLIDAYIFGRTDPYWYPQYMHVEDIMANLRPILFASKELGGDPGLGVGVIIILLIVTAFSVIYVFIKTRSIVRSIVCCAAVFWLPGMVSVLLVLFIPILIPRPLDGAGSQELRALAEFGYIFLCQLFLCAGLTLLLIYRDNKQIIKTLLKHSNLHVISILIVTALLGLYISKGSRIFEVMLLPFLVLTLFLIVLLWEFVVIVLDRPGLKEQNILTERQHLGAAGFIMMLAIMLSILLNWLPFTLSIIFIATAIILAKSTKKLERKKDIGVVTMITLITWCSIALWTVLSFLIGWFALAP